MIKREYHLWIDEFVGRHKGRVRGLCQSAATEMVERFPELRKATGFILPDEAARAELPTPNMDLDARRSAWDRDVGLEQHAWCVEPDGGIVDPTISQYRGGEFVYVEYEAALHGPLPQGKCPDCGEIVFPEQRGFCDEVCRQRWDKFMAEETGGAR